jgi:hypothetical protein
MMRMADTCKKSVSKKIGAHYSSWGSRKHHIYLSKGGSSINLFGWRRKKNDRTTCHFFSSLKFEWHIAYLKP